MTEMWTVRSIENDQKLFEGSETKAMAYIRHRAEFDGKADAYLEAPDKREFEYNHDLDVWSEC